MRVTRHSGRVSKSGVAYSARHNDRNDIGIADNIHPERSSNNRYGVCYQGMTFADAERTFYEKHFSDALNARNDMYIKNGHRDRCQTIDEYITNPRSCPEETIWAIGNVDKTVDPDVLMDCWKEQASWEHEKFPNCQLLDVALHMDEDGAPHIHSRSVWIAHDKDGNEVVSQSKALAEMGIEAPNPDKKVSKYNNPKMVYTATCREHFIELCRERGLELTVEPKEPSKSGLDLDAYKHLREQERLKELERQSLEQQRTIAELQERLDAKRLESSDLDKSITEQKELITSQNDTIKQNTLDVERSTKRKESADKFISEASKGSAEVVNIPFKGKGVFIPSKEPERLLERFEAFEGVDYKTLNKERRDARKQSKELSKQLEDVGRERDDYKSKYNTAKSKSDTLEAKNKDLTTELNNYKQYDNHQSYVLAKVYKKYRNRLPEAERGEFDSLYSVVAQDYTNGFNDMLKDFNSITKTHNAPALDLDIDDREEH